MVLVINNSWKQKWIFKKIAEQTNFFMWKKSKQNIKFVLIQIWFLYSNINIQIWTPAQKFNL